MNQYQACVSFLAHKRLFAFNPELPRVVQCVQRESDEPRSAWQQSAYDWLVGMQIMDEVLVITMLQQDIDATYPPDEIYGM